MDRVKLFELAQRLRNQVDIIDNFLRREDDPVVALEALGRCNIVDQIVAEIRAEVGGVQSRRPDNDNVHVLGNRGGEAA